MIIRKQLDNKIRVVMEPMKEFVSVSIGVWIEAGSSDETPENNGIAHVVEHMLFKGTDKRSARDIADEMTAIGDHLDAYTSKECTCYYTKTLGEYAYPALEIISDMIKNSRIDEKDLQKELGIILDEIDMYEDDADELVHELLQKFIWKDHPLGYIISGEKDVVRSFSTETVRNFIHHYYTGNRILISVAGCFEANQMLNDIRKLFGDIPAGDSEKIPKAPSYSQVIVCRHKDIEQMHMDLAFNAIPYEHEDKYVMGVVNSILGGNVNSRLFQEVREEKGLVYNVYSYSNSFKQCGLFQIYAAMSPEQTALVLDAILEAIHKMASGPVPEKELMLTKRQLRIELLMAEENTHDRMETNAKTWIYNEKQETIDEITSHIEAVTATDILQFMQKYLKIENVSLALIGNFSGVDTDAVNNVLKKWRVPLNCRRID